MQLDRTRIAGRRDGGHAGSARRAGSRRRAVRVRLHHRSAGRRRPRRAARLPHAPSDHDEGIRPHARGLHRHQSRRAQCDAARPDSRLRPEVAARGDRRPRHRPAGRQQQRARRRRFACARSCRSWPRAACRRTASACAPIRPTDRRWRQCASAIRGSRRKPGPAASGRKTSARASTATISRTSRCGTTAAPASAILPPWSTIRPISSQPRAETAAYTMRRTTVMEKYRQGVDTATSPSATSDGGQDFRCRQIGVQIGVNEPSTS